MTSAGHMRYTRCFQSEASSERHWDVAARVVLCTKTVKVEEISMQGDPLKHMSMETFGYQVIQIERASRFPKSVMHNQISCVKKLSCVTPFCQPNDSPKEVIAACSTGLYALEATGEIKYKIIVQLWKCCWQWRLESVKYMY